MWFQQSKAEFYFDGPLTVYVYRPADGHDSTNDGASSRHDAMVLYPENAVEGLGKDTDAVLVLVAHRTGLRAVPFDLWRQGKHGMFGANFVATHDSSLPIQVKVFDRVERSGS